MKLLHRFLLATVALLAACPAPAAPLGTGFTYQGQLTQNGNPVNGTVDLRFSLWDAAGSGQPPVGGIRIGARELVNGVAVSNGLFVVLLNEAGGFGPTAFTGDARWLQIEVCGDPACATSTVMAPRQPVTATPYSLHSAGPWQTAGQNVHFSAGSVGIGTSTPTTSLDVRGASQATFRATNTASDPGIASFAGVFRAEGTTPENRAGSFIATGPGTNYAGFFNATGGATNFAIWSENGVNHFRQRVGIGTSTPTNALSVFGTADFSGFVGIGIPTPASMLSVRGVGPTSASSSLNVTNSSGTSALFVRDDLKIGIGTTSPFHLLQIGGAFDGHLGFGASDVSPNAGYVRFGDNTGWRIHLGRAREGSGGPINTGTTGAVMTVVDQGNVGIGTTTPSQRLHVVGNICATGSIGACSDLRYKERIVPLGSSLSNVLSLRGVSFAWKPDAYPDIGPGGESQIGLIAQEVERVYPEVVLTGSDGYKSVDYARLTPALIEAIRELNARIELLEARLAPAGSSARSLDAEPQSAGREPEPGR